MKIKAGDVVKLKSLTQVVNENEVESISVSSISFKDDNCGVIKGMFKFFGGEELTVEKIKSNNFISTSSSCTFSIDWIDKIIPQKKSCWDKPELSIQNYYLKTNGEVRSFSYNVGWFDDYNQGNICLEKEPLDFLSKQREVEFKVRKFMAENNGKNPMFEISYEMNRYESKYYFEVLFRDGNRNTKWRFSSKKLAHECLELIGKENWKKYILEV